MDLIDQAKVNGIKMMAWTADELYGRDGWSLRKLLRVAFGRWPIEDCFREAKEELGLDHFECRGWRCIHRHLYVTILSQLFCATVRKQLSPSEDVFSGELLTMEQVRRAANVFVGALGLPRRCRQERYQQESSRQQYYSHGELIVCRDWFVYKRCGGVLPRLMASGCLRRLFLRSSKQQPSIIQK